MAHWVDFKEAFAHYPETGHGGAHLQSWEVIGLIVPGHLWLHEDFIASLDYMRVGLKAKSINNQIPRSIRWQQWGARPRL